MLYDIQTNALVPYLGFAIAYLIILAVAGKKRDLWALFLIMAFMLLLGIRDTDKMDPYQDPVWYAKILTKEIPSESILVIGGYDYLPFYLLHGFTSVAFNYAQAFFFLHLLYLPLLALVFRSSRRIPGMFFLLSGWLLFVNSGILLICNFFRQGTAALWLLLMIFCVSLSQGNRWWRWAGVLSMPFLHVSSIPLLPGLLTARSRRFKTLYGLCFVGFFVIMSLGIQSIGSYAGYANGLSETNFKQDLIVKVAGTYILLLVAMWAEKSASQPLNEEVKKVHSVMRGLLLPSAALLLLVNTAPEIGTRFIYYFHTIAFAYLTSAIVCSKKNWAYAACAICMCLFGAVTWTYPSVAMLLIW